MTLKKAFPDLQYNATIQQVEGNIAHLTPHLTGSHTGDLDLTTTRLDIIPPSDKTINLLEETAQITVKGGKLVNYHVVPMSGGGLLGILTQLGVEARQ